MSLIGFVTLVIAIFVIGGILASLKCVEAGYKTRQSGLFIQGLLYFPILFGWTLLMEWAGEDPSYQKAGNWGLFGTLVVMTYSLMNGWDGFKLWWADGHPAVDTKPPELTLADYERLEQIAGARLEPEPIPHPSFREELRNEHAVIVAQCLRGDTPIFDPNTGITKTVLQRYHDGLPFHVYALTRQGSVVTTTAHPPKRFPVTKMVKLTNGKTELFVTPQHRVWTGHSFLPLSELDRGASFHLPTTSERALAMYMQGAQCSKQIRAGFLACYHLGHRLYGLLPLQVLGIDQGSFPLLSGARERSYKRCEMGALENTPSHNHFYQDAFLPSMQGFSHLESSAPWTELAPQRESGTFSSLVRLRVKAFVSAVATFPSRITQVAYQFALGSIFLPFHKYNTWWQEPATDDVYYDFFVPEHNNYYACGLFHHNSGHGKTQFLQSLILDDLEKDATVIVIDSQSQLINNLLHVVPLNRLVHITPTDDEYPLALNLFDSGQDATMYEYIFGALDAEMTSKQAMVYRYLSRFLSVIPGATIDTMRQLLEKGGVGPYSQYLEKLPRIAQAFFDNEFQSRQYDETRQQIARRLYTLLENDQFFSMFSAPKMKLNMPVAIDGRNVILVDTSKRVLKGDSFKIFGRFFIAQIANAIFNRDHPYGHRVYVYIDEFQEYAGEEDFVQELFTQARKFNVSLTVAFQFLDQLPDAVYRAIMANTAVKAVGGVSAPDKRALAAEFGEKADLFTTPPKGFFYVQQKGNRNELMQVPFGRLEEMGTRSKAELLKIRERMQELYGYQRFNSSGQNREEPKLSQARPDEFDERS